ncbi:hypothetical protein VTO73DRAFT_11231 [Trametes versicolor]
MRKGAPRVPRPPCLFPGTDHPTDLLPPPDRVVHVSASRNWAPMPRPPLSWDVDFQRAPTRAALTSPPLPRAALALPPPVLYSAEGPCSVDVSGGPARSNGMPTASRTHAAPRASLTRRAGSMHHDALALRFAARSAKKIFASFRPISVVERAHSAAPAAPSPPFVGVSGDVASRRRGGGAPLKPSA